MVQQLLLVEIIAYNMTLKVKNNHHTGTKDIESAWLCSLCAYKNCNEHCVLNSEGSELKCHSRTCSQVYIFYIEFCVPYLNLSIHQKTPFILFEYV